MFPPFPGWRSYGFDLCTVRVTVLPYASLRQRGVVFLPAFSEPYMNLIALDTSTEFLSLAIAIDGTLLNEHQHVGQRHAELTLPLLRSLLAYSQHALQDFDAIVYSQGPGAFTGLRIGCGIAQGLALAAGLPLIGIPTLDVLAHQHPGPRVLACLDARMGEVYAAAYDKETGSVPLAMGVWKPQELPVPDGQWQGAGNGFAVFGDSLAERLGASLTDADSSLAPSASAMIELARSQRYSRIAPEQAELVYLRNKVALTTAERARQ